MRRLLIVLGAIVVALVAWMIMRPSAPERMARQDVQSLATAVASHVEQHGVLPRVTVTTIPPGGIDPLWGPDFLVESQLVERADPEDARIFYVVGEIDDWCVEALYTPASSWWPNFAWLDDAPSAWVSARGMQGAMGKVVDGRCGDDYMLTLSPVTASGTPEPGSLIDAASAPEGTCLTGVLDGGVPTGPVEVADCEQPHFAEIFHAGEMPGDDYEMAWESAAETCATVFPDVVGTPRNISEFAEEPFTVSGDDWAEGARSFSCVLYLSSDAYPLIGSAGDSWR